MTKNKSSQTLFEEIFDGLMASALKLNELTEDQIFITKALGQLQTEVNKNE